MATRLVQYSRNVKLSSSRLLLNKCRVFFSSAPDVLDVHVQDTTDETTNSQTVWPDHLLGPLGPQDKRFPMPGRVGPCINSAQLRQIININRTSQPAAVEPDNVLPKLSSERHIDIVEQFLTSLDELDIDFIDRGVPYPSTSDLIEYKAYNCPQILRKDFKDLFPDKNIIEGVLTVMTICLFTNNDMAVWSTDMEKEQEELQETFLQAAVGICQAFEDSGYWADFIDPSSGKPFKNPHTNSTLSGTDNHYRSIGFDIEDLGCCKVISHPEWGSHIFVGSLFTSAPLNHLLIKNLTD